MRLIKDIVERYCQSYGIEPEKLNTYREFKGKYITRDSKVYNGVHVDYMRMCLAYYFRSLNIPVGFIWPHIGYRGHSVISRQARKVGELLDMNDPYIMPYWLRLKEVVQLKQAA